MKSKIIFKLKVIALLLFGGNAIAQSVTGTVSDNTGPLPGVSIVVKGLSQTSITDIDGKFSIEVPSPSVLVFNYIGYQTQDQNVTPGSTINVILKEESKSLDEVVVTGYVGQKKNSISGAVSEVNIQNLAKTRVPDITQALQGQVAGVFVAASTGAPGDGIRLRIRGEGTLGNNDALYVVDGVPTRDISFLNQNDIKNITVLKDAAAGAIYGSRAAGGVVVITTNKGVSGKSTLDVDVFTGIHFATNLPDMLNADQYLTIEDRAWHNSVNNAPDAESPYVRDRRTRSLADTDWLDELFKTGLSNNFQVSASGGSENTQYLVSGGYYGIDGIQLRMVM